MTQTAREQISEMTETTETTLARTFGWETPEARLYRDCPTAFWLAPDGDGVLNPPAPGPILPTGFAQPANKDDDAADVVEGMNYAVLVAVLAAGPIFAAAALLLMPIDVDRDWVSAMGQAAMSIVAFPLTVPIGGFLALLPVLVGVLALGNAGQTIPTLRRPAAWALTGGVMGLTLATMFDTGVAVGLAVITTSVACASIARHFVDWKGPQSA